MNWKTMLLTGVVVVLCGWLAAWQVWEVVAPKPDEPMHEQAVMMKQIQSLRDELKALKQSAEKDHEEYVSQVASMKKQLEDQRKYLLIYKKDRIAAKGPTLNADQDIHKFVQDALKEEPVQPIKGDADLLERARAVGLKSVVLK
jgi:hypothetical protein